MIEWNDALTTLFFSLLKHDATAVQAEEDSMIVVCYTAFNIVIVFPKIDGEIYLRHVS